MKKSLGIIVLMACLATDGVSVPAWSMMGGGPMAGGGGFGREPGMFFPAILHNLNLTPDQMQQVRTILDGHRSTFHTLFPQLRDAQQGLAGKLVSTDPVTLADLTPRIQRVADLRKQLMQEGVNVALEVRAVLTPDQLTQAAQIQQRMEALHQEMRNLVGDPPPPPPDAE